MSDEHPVRRAISRKEWEQTLSSQEHRVFDKLSNDMQVDRLCTCGSLVIDVSFAELLESQKLSF